jgi:transcriptional regulator GlxA family with amidase domain
MRRKGFLAALAAGVGLPALGIGVARALDSRTATTHHGSHTDFEARYPRIELVRGERFVEHDRVATAAGLTSGIDLALRVVERYLGRPAAEGTARYMEHESARWRSA